MKSSWRLSSATWRSAAAVAVMLTGAGAVWRVAPSLAQYTTAIVREAREQSAGTAGRGRAETALPTTAMEVGAAPIANDSASAIVASAGETTAADDSITWTPAVARTWVNVRSDASRGGQVVGVIKPTTRAMLGTDRAGWRLVKSTDVQGWVDPRLFEADSLRTRGE